MAKSSHINVYKYFFIPNLILNFFIIINFLTISWQPNIFTILSQSSSGRSVLLLLLDVILCHFVFLLRIRLCAGTRVKVQMGGLNSKWSSISVRDLMGFEVQRNSFYKSSRVIEHMHHWNLGKGQHSKPTSYCMNHWWYKRNLFLSYWWHCSNALRMCSGKKKLKEKKNECVDRFYL